MSAKTNFFSLPAELRNNIYRLCLVEQEYPLSRLNCPIPMDAYEPELSQVCRQLRREALPIFYGCNTFRCISWTELYVFLLAIGPRNRDSLQSLELPFPDAEYVSYGRGHTPIRFAEIPDWFTPPRPDLVKFFFDDVTESCLRLLSNCSLLKRIRFTTLPGDRQDIRTMQQRLKQFKSIKAVDSNGIGIGASATKLDAAIEGLVDPSYLHV